MQAAADDSSHPYLNKEQAKIRGLFDRIAHRYDLLNHLFSFNLDKRWRKLAVNCLAPKDNGCYLDACAGTGDLSFAIAKRIQKEAKTAKTIAADFSLPMLIHAQEKKSQRAEKEKLIELPNFLAGDTMRLPFADKSFDGVTVAFGIRNVEVLQEGLKEIRRILKPGGRLVILEFTPIKNKLVKPFFDFYCHGIIPFIGNLISGSSDKAYSYLQQSIDRWPNADDFASQLKEAGFSSAGFNRLLPYNVALHWADR